MEIMQEPPAADMTREEWIVLQLKQIEMAMRCVDFGQREITVDHQIETVEHGDKRFVHTGREEIRITLIPVYPSVEVREWQMK